MNIQYILVCKYLPYIAQRVRLSVGSSTKVEHTSVWTHLWPQGVPQLPLNMLSLQLLLWNNPFTIVQFSPVLEFFLNYIKGFRDEHFWSVAIISKRFYQHVHQVSICLSAPLLLRFGFKSWMISFWLLPLVTAVLVLFDMIAAFKAVCLILVFLKNVCLWPLILIGSPKG